MTCDNRKRYLAIIAVRYLRAHPFESIWFDAAECDGECLANDIAVEWDLDESEIAESET